MAVTALSPPILSGAPERWSLILPTPHWLLMAEHREISLLLHSHRCSYSGQGYHPPASHQIGENQFVLSSLSLFTNLIWLTTHPSLEPSPSFSDTAALCFASYLSVLLWSYCGLLLPVLKSKVIFPGFFSWSSAFPGPP